jgi:hypothetical protein
MSKGVNNDKLYDEIIRQNVYIVQNACAIADKIHSKGVRWVESNINDAVDSIKGLPEYMKEILSDCVIKSLMAVDYIKVKDDLFDSQKEKYN